MKPIVHIRQIFSAVFFLFSISLFAQLPAFTLAVTPTPQTCLGNGSLAFTTSGTVPGASISYAVYLLPNITNPIATTAATSLNSLVSGRYTVVATQALNNQTSSASATAEITNGVVDLRFTPVPGNVTCNNNGTITVNVTSGTAVSYQIISGPVMRPLQSSNVFTGLPVGLYGVRVYDNCGEAVVVSVTLIQVNTSINIGVGALPGGALPSCGTINVSNVFMAPAPLQVIYPIVLRYTVYPPGGAAPIVVTRTLTQAPLNDEAIGTIPFYDNQQYSYTLTIIDACGNSFTSTGNAVNTTLRVTGTPKFPDCDGRYFVVEPNNFVAPYTVTFTDAPAGFTPAAYSSLYPTYTQPAAQFGSQTQQVPEGSYSVLIRDACGRTATTTFSVVPPDLEPLVVTQAQCGNPLGSIAIGIPGRTIATVTITLAPTAYTGPVPDDLSEYITAIGGFALNNVPLGNYSFSIEDTCGDTYVAYVDLQPTASAAGVVVIPRPGCDEGKGSVRVFADGDVDFTSVVIVAAPAAFTENLPYNVSANINQTGNTAGELYINSLPEGQYTIRFTDGCGFTQEQPVTVTGYHINTSEVTIIPHCGSFDVDLEYYSTGGYAQSFWLQKYDEATDTWGHPVTGVPYVNGLPEVSNSIPLVVNTVNINNPYVGTFRILKFFYTYGNGTSVNNRCMEEVEEFTFDGGPQITNAYSFPCGNGLTEVVLEVTGVPPFTYGITSKNGDTSFTVDNGSSNLFSALAPANYNFQVMDNCRNVRNRDFTITEEQPLLITPDGFCEGEYSTLTTPQFTFLSYKWYKQGSPGTILSTAAILEFPAYNSATQSGTYVLEIRAQNPQSCLNQTLRYTVAPNAVPNAGTDGTDSLCNPFTVIDLTTYLGASFDAAGAWTDNDATGALTGGTFNTALLSAGTYHFTYTVTGLCNLTDTATVTITLKNTPTAPSFAPITVCEGATITLGSLTLPGVSFSWTGPNGFTSTDQNPVLTNITLAQAGDYYLTVSAFGCTSPPSVATVTVSPLPYAGTDGIDAICNTGGSINLTSYLGSTYTTGGTWTDVDGAGGLTGDIFTTTGVAGGVYHFKYAVTNFCNVTDEAIVTITLNTIQTAPVLAPITPVCEGTDVALAAAITVIPNAVYAWTGPNGFTSSQPKPTLTSANTTASGVYSLVVTVNGCPSPAADVIVLVNPYPQFAIEGDAVLCDGQTTELSVNPSNFTTATYKWYLDNALQPAATDARIEISATGTYRVEVTTGMCTTPAEFLVLPNTNAFDVMLEAGCENERYVIRISNLGEIQDVASITWEGPGGFNAVGESADITDGATGIYTAVVTNTNGCSATADVPVTNTHCFIPRGISPGDGQYNDNFDLSNLGVRHIKIFNRYGLQVYEKANYLNEWYGQSDKGDLPTGTYFYVITLSEGKQVTGWVYLLKRV